jgi:hypothetical protein
VAAYQKLWSVLAGRNHDPNGVMSTLLLVVFGQSLPQTMYFDADTGVFALLEVLELPEDVYGDRVFRNGLGVIHERLAANVT